MIAATFIEAEVTRQFRHVVGGGDLDTDPPATSVRFWTGRQSLNGVSVCYRDAWESKHPRESGQPFTPDNPTSPRPGCQRHVCPCRDWPHRRIDYVLVRLGMHGGNALDGLHCERVFDQPVDGVWASDHFGLVADVAAGPWPSSSESKT